MLVAEHTPNTLNIHDGMFLILPLSKVRRTEDERQELVVSQCELFKGAKSKKIINLTAFAFLCLSQLLVSALGNSGKAKRIEQ